jgi:LacI family transcriptional regulator
MTTLKDIAKEAGVTVMTVSNVINGKYDKVSKSTVETVTEIARRLDYVPSATARSLVAKSSRLVGVLLPATKDEGIFLSTHNVAVIGVIERLLLESYAAHGDFMNVRLDDRRGGYLATCHLIQNGHRRIAFVGTQKSERGVDRERYEGYLEALKEADIHDEPVALLSPAVTYAHGVEAGMKLCTEHPEITAVFATADQFAVGIIDGVRSLGRTVPDDLSVVGFDNLEIAATSRPPLTTVTQDVNRKAATAVDLLLQSLQSKEDQPGETILDVELLERESVRNLNPA